MVTRPTSTRKDRRWFLLLLLIPYIFLLIPSFYNALAPSFLGIPYFYWYQMLWIILTAIITALVYFMGA
ncbi:DUF3311 domain-containing protein [Dictyobacter arantiisoli]|uniref:DUF3311 domain-containing protein n=1 Tax=Dictyobacter arantiisoli TaxID=2014874 RepID=A0A5A5T9G9_9CHLR|nr:DUF3311 domain-containing protein [Dictyobacter arantiisoli]GCF07639.1 hypothetical protein KDI_12030 [Dictyobacter arantiisoli]